MSKKKSIETDQKPNFKLKRKVRLKSLDPRYAPRVRKELLDADYLDQLDEDTLKWYAQFTDEWAAASISKTKAGKVKAGHIHTTNEQAKQLYDANNKRNNDVFGVTKANSLLRTIEMTTRDGEDDIREVDTIINFANVEDCIGQIIDEKHRIETIIKKDVLTEEEHENILLTKTEVLRMIRHGANIPKEMLDFYKKYYKLE